MSEVPRSDGAAPKPLPPIGLLGLSVAETRADDLRPLQTAMPRHRAWLRSLKFVLLAVIPAGVAWAAHLASEPEGLDVSGVRASGARVMDTAAPAVAPSALPRRVFDDGAFGHSGAVRVRVALPGETVLLPMRLVGPTDGLSATWIGFDGNRGDAIVTWPADGRITAPSRAGAYWLVLQRQGVADTVADFAMFVERPMPNARATGINGYHLGRWPKAAGAIVPKGFVEVTQGLADFPLTPHLRMSDFVVHDDQEAFPKYLHVRESLLDKLELVIAEVAQMRGRSAKTLSLHVASGFRSPAHNGSLSASAKDSRHMYGDAADIAIDANFDGKLTEIDARLVAAAAEVVERKYPDLIGGIGLYINADGAGWPYVHIDTRGVRARWRGGPRRDVEVDSFPVGEAGASAPAPAAESAQAPKAGATSPTPPPAALPATPPPFAAPAMNSAPRGDAPSRPATTTPVRPVSNTTRVAPDRPAAAPAPVSASRPAVKPAARPSRRAVRKAAAPAASSGGAARRTSPVAVTDDPFASASRRFRAARP